MERKGYEDFVDQFTSSLRKDHPSVCFYMYGSYVRGDYHPEVNSDIDGGLIFDSGVITPKEEILTIAERLAECLARNRIPLQINLLDRITSRDGRFLSYTVDFTDHIKTRGRVLSGPDFLGDLNGLDYKSGVLSSFAFNLRGMRNGLLEARDLAAHHPDELRDTIQDTLTRIVKLPKKLFWLQGEDIIVETVQEALCRLPALVPGYDMNQLYEWDRLRRSADDLPIGEEGVQLMARAVESAETLVKRYIERFPLPSERELRL